MRNSLLELFEALFRDFGPLTVSQFTDAMKKGGAKRFAFWHAVSQTPLAPVSTPLSDYKNTVADDALPESVREDALRQLKYKLEETIQSLRTGAVTSPRKKIPAEVVNRITDPKIRQLCMEINGTADQNVVSIAQLIGETLKWTVWFRAKQRNTRLTEKAGLQQLLDEAISQSYFTGNAAVRFLRDFRDNFLKTSYDMVRHSETYIPDITVLNPQVDALQVLLEECF